MTNDNAIRKQAIEPEEDDLLNSGLSLDVEPDEDESTANPDLALTRKINGVASLLRTYYAQSAKGNACADPLRGQGRVLALLAMKPETTQKELQFLLDMKQQSLSELLAKLEAKGFVEREKSVEDGRVTVVRLTESGAAAAPDPEGSNAALGAYDCFDDQERETFEGLVTRLETALREKVGGVENECEHGDHEDGEQKRHRHGQQGRGAMAGGGHGKGARGESAPTQGKGKGASYGKGAAHGKGGGAGHGKGGQASPGSAANLIDIATGLAGLGSGSRGGRGRGGRGGR